MSARDVAIVTRAALQDPLFSEIVATPTPSSVQSCFPTATGHDDEPSSRKASSLASKGNHAKAGGAW